MCQRDHPVVEKLLESGYDPAPEVICPLCFCEAESFCISDDNEILGCENCTRMDEAWKYVGDEFVVRY